MSKTANGKHPGGRPTKYKREYCEALIDFFDVEPYEDVDIDHYKEGKVAWRDSKRVANKLPTLWAFAKSVGVGYSTVRDWLRENHASYQAKFSVAFTQAEEARKDFLIQNGLQGLYPPASFVFVATNLTDMRNKQEVDHGVTDELGDLLKEINGSRITPKT